MRFYLALMSFFLKSPSRRRNLKSLARYFLALMTLVVIYSAIFHFLMIWEGREQPTWFTGVYWTLTVMSTLGFGDITFQSDLGRAFSTIVLLSGTVFMLVLLPFTFLQFFWTPWMKAQEEARRPQLTNPEIFGHVVITQHDPVSTALIDRLIQFHYSYVLIEPDVNEATRMADDGLNVIAGDLDDPDTYVRACVKDASLIVTACTDEVNAQVALTVRGMSEEIEIISTADVPASVDILQLAGSDHVLQLADMLGESLARRITAGDAIAHVIGEFGELLIAEATVLRTPLVGKSIAESGLRETVGITVVGLWERGQFQAARPESMITENTVLVLAATEEQLYRYNSLFAIYNQSSNPVIIIGSGRVGRSTARALSDREVDYCVLERDSNAVDDNSKTIVGSAAELDVLKKAGIEKAPAVVLTTSDDDTNVYLAIYCRQLRPDIQIIARANLERNIATLHRAGTDFVMSYPSMGAREIVNFLKRSSTLMIAEGLQVVRLPVPDSLVGKTIAESQIRPRTGCSVVATGLNGSTTVNPDPMEILPEGGELILIATADGERNFFLEFDVGFD